MLGILVVFFFQAEDGIRDLVRSRGLGDVYKRQVQHRVHSDDFADGSLPWVGAGPGLEADAEGTS